MERATKNPLLEKERLTMEQKEKNAWSAIETFLQTLKELEQFAAAEGLLQEKRNPAPIEYIQRTAEKPKSGFMRYFINSGDKSGTQKRFFINWVNSDGSNKTLSCSFEFFEEYMEPILSDDDSAALEAAAKSPR